LPAFQNTLYYGDNLEVLKRYLKDESVDLIYLDPPFKSNQDYNVLFAEINVFGDSWHWYQGAALESRGIVRSRSSRAKENREEC
jgi:site-specific DNA-methyltransferase (adenine-specific)